MATTSVSKVFIDTNVLIRSNLATAPLHAEARQAIGYLWDAGAQLWISRQVLREYMANVTRPQTYAQPLPPDVVIRRVRFFQAQFDVADEQAEVTAKLLTLLDAIALGGKQVHDANIVATMQAYDIPTLLTHNTTDFARFSSLIGLLSLEDVLKMLKS
jgi:predicted nucleic acid-binding protein